MHNHEEYKEIIQLNKWLEGSFALPYKLTLLITNKCNLTCLFCEGAKNRAPKNKKLLELPDDAWMKIVKEGIRMGVVEWWIPGNGDPLCRSDLILKIFKAVKSTSPKSICKITTNGALFTDNMIQEYVKIGVDRISISLDSPEAKTHDFLRDRKGTFERVHKTLLGFNFWKKKFKSDKPKINFNTVLTSKNYNHLAALVDFASHLGIEYISLNPLRVSDCNIKKVNNYKLRLNPQQKREAASQIQRLQTGGNNKTRLVLNGFEQLEMGRMVANSAEGFECEDKPKKKLGFKDSFINSPCFEPWLTMTINYKGDVTYCTSCGNWDRAENVKDKPLKDIWLGDSFKYARSCILNHTPFSSCYGCGIKDVRRSIIRKLNEYCAKNE